MKFTKRLCSALLCVITLLSAFPLNAFAYEFPQQAPELTYHDSDYKCAEFGGTLTIEGINPVYDIERSTDGKTWGNITHEDIYNDYNIELLKKVPATYFRFRVLWTDEKTGKKFYSLYSNVVKVEQNFRELLYSSDVEEPYASNDKVEIKWNVSKDVKDCIDGFLVYRALNGGDYKEIGTVSASKFEKFDKYDIEYTFKEKAPNKYAYIAKYKIIPYFNTANGKYFKESSKVVTRAENVNYDMVTVIPNKNSVVIKFKKPDKNTKFIIWYNTEGDYDGFDKKRAKKITTSKTKVVLKNIKYAKTNCYIRIVPAWGDLKIKEAMYLESYRSAPAIAKAKRKHRKKVPVIDVKGKKTRKKKSIKISKKDKKIIKKFLNKKSIKKQKTMEDKVYKIFDELQYKTKLDKSGKSAKLSDIQAALVKRRATKSQVNRAAAIILCYLGYEARIVKGEVKEQQDVEPYNDYMMNLDWIEIKIKGRWYVCDVRFMGGKPNIVALNYPETGAYFYKNGKPAVYWY